VIVGRTEMRDQLAGLTNFMGYAFCAVFRHDRHVKVPHSAPPPASPRH
jgi:hypothetical protein